MRKDGERISLRWKKRKREKGGSKNGKQQEILWGYQETLMVVIE